MRGSCLAALAVLCAVPAGLAAITVTNAAEPRFPGALRTATLNPVPAGSPAYSVSTSFDGTPLPTEVLTPVLQCPTGFQAPSDAAWVRSTARLTYYSEGFVVGLRPSMGAATSDDAVPQPIRRPPEIRKPETGKPVAVRTASLGSVPLPRPRPANVPSLAEVEQATEPQIVPTRAAAKPIDSRPLTARQRKSADRAPPEIEELIARHAARFDVPERLVRRVAWRESKFEPKARNGPYWGLMQISAATARGLGFRGQPAELLDADTNMTFAVAYLANAYKVAGRNEDRAVALYARGYYYEAKRKGLLSALIKTAAVTN